MPVLCFTACSQPKTFLDPFMCLLLGHFFLRNTYTAAPLYRRLKQGEGVPVTVRLQGSPPTSLGSLFENCGNCRKRDTAPRYEPHVFLCVESPCKKP
jgi:hypothetical protein